MLKEQNIRCSVIGLAASVHICQKLCRDTQGTTTAAVTTRIVTTTVFVSEPDEGISSLNNWQHQLMYARLANF